MYKHPLGNVTRNVHGYKIFRTVQSPVRHTSIRTCLNLFEAGLNSPDSSDFSNSSRSFKISDYD